MVGLLVSLTIGIALGIWPIATQVNDPGYVLIHALVLMIPPTVIFGFFIASGVQYTIVIAQDHGTTWWQEFKARPSLKPLLIVAAVGGSVMLCVGTFWVAGVIGRFPRELLYLEPLVLLPRPLVVGIGIVLSAFVFLVWAAVNAVSYARDNHTSWLYEFWYNHWTTVALSMFIVIAGAIIFLAFNAIAITVERL
jgi:hypothetical protein